MNNDPKNAVVDVTKLYKKVNINNIEEIIETVIILRDKVEILTETVLQLREEKQKAINDLEDIIDSYHACEFCARVLPSMGCALDEKYGDGTCSAKWRGIKSEKGEIIYE